MDTKVNKVNNKYKLNSKSRWYKFKHWCYRNHKYIAIMMLAILLLIGISYKHHPGEIKNKIQIGGVSGISDQLGSLAKNDIGKTLKTTVDSSSDKMRALAKISKDAGLRAPDAAMDKFRSSSSFIYDILYQISFIIIIMLIIFPSLAFFVIGMICFVLLRNKLAYLKSF